MGLPEAQKARRAAARWLTVSTRDLEEALKQADEGNVEEAIVDDEALDKDIDASFAFKRSVLTTRNAAQSWIERLSPPNAQFDELSLGSSKRSTSVRLPKLTLPTFDGKRNLII
ncbi:hypothetical protein CAPTEDRAFT_215493 [Capitella teleta]|uniref:Uncharacterized protein n=1 Tax=Capitella teleta TaxID=283909 RepID=R7U2S0_CAPTE|nr:hypothetical protein CAPTEDRAFT_215493 [Capitella teleta]|eukprot:ELU00401.1 hypothetical protein CAPTEDRAFT_215493 [Capitella teleta]